MRQEKMLLLFGISITLYFAGMILGGPTLGGLAEIGGILVFGMLIGYISAENRTHLLTHVRWFWFLIGSFMLIIAGIIYARSLAPYSSPVLLTPLLFLALLAFGASLGFFWGERKSRK